ncbi:MAG: T9SS type A sorting domain-containing protein [Chitinophagaceae bacterium]|nr:T9SS type A sorting domain-containing protein [Chitinophagaceae bacterium]
MNKSLPHLTLLSVITLCAVFLCSQASAQVFKTGKGYLNLTKGASGGTFEPGDILEVRSTFALQNGTMGLVRYVDTIPTNTSYVVGSLKLTTNEGVPFRTFTDAGNDDAGMYDPVTRTLKMNAGHTNDAGGKVTSTNPSIDRNSAPYINNVSKPSFYGSTCIIVASYRIRINNVPVNTQLYSFGGAFHYIFNNVDRIARLPSFLIKVAPNLGLCVNKVSQNSIIDNGGTFGQGTSQTRTTNSSLVTGYTFTSINANSPNDGFYSIVNNTSSTGATNNNVNYNGASSRVFGNWEIGGDHTSATNQAAGNPSRPVNTSAGYMLVVNADYVNGVAARQPISNLCDETFYEFSAWVKNICKYCGCDIDGDGAFSSNYRTAFPGDSSGVKPNLTFEVNGESVYTTGDIAFTGSWVKKGFIFKTKPGEQNITISIRNNSSGGGGNDWALDDLSLSICGPGISVTPTRITDCNNNYINMEATVKYFQQNYGSYVWERSTNAGATWTTTPNSGSTTPTLAPDGQYEYTVQYPPFITSASDNGSRYRLRVASNSGNLGGLNCSYVDTTVASLTIFDCAVLPVDFISFTGSRTSNRNTLNWRTQREVNQSTYTLQRSIDAVNYTDVTIINSQNKEGVNTYNYNDLIAASGKTTYKILIKDLVTGRSKYTNMIALNSGAVSDQPVINILENPFKRNITVEVTTSEKEEIKVSLIDIYGRIVKTGNYAVDPGYRKINFNDLDALSPGFYALKINIGGQTVTKKMIKQ